MLLLTAAVLAFPALDPSRVALEVLRFERSAAATAERAYVAEVVSGERSVEEACGVLEPAGEAGQAACAELARLRAARAAAAARLAKAPPALKPASLGALAGIRLDAAGLRGGFDGARAAAAPGAVQAAAQSPTQPATGEKKEEDEKGLRIVSVAWEQVLKIGKKELYKERKQDFEEAFGIRPGTRLGGAGVFTAKILSPKEVEADAVKHGVRQAAEDQGRKVSFLRTNTKAQLFGDHHIPVGKAGPMDVGFGLRVGGVVEIVETRVIDRELKGIWEDAKERVYKWPLSAESLREHMQVGEDLTITGRLEKGAGLGAGMGKQLGASPFGSVGVRAGVSTGRAEDEWVTLRIHKTGPETVRLLLQRGDGEAMSVNVSLTAGLDIYEDSFIPTVHPEGIDDGFVGKLALKGEHSLLKTIEKLASAELSASWARGKHEAKTEGWSAVSLSDPGSAKALDQLFRFKPQALLEMKQGRLSAEVRDVTYDATLQARLSKLKLTRSGGTVFYEVRWAQDGGAPKRYVVGIARSSMRGDVTKTARNEESVMWYDLDGGEAAVTASLGPQKRLMTTTREKINDVLAAQKALGLEVDGSIDHPSPYLEFFGLGNYGRSEENGRFSLKPEGVAAVRGRSREELVAAYLKADWLFERESFPPGVNFWAQSAPPPWAETRDPAVLGPVLAFLKANSAEALRLRHDRDQSHQLTWLERKYEQLAPGRRLTADAEAYTSAASYANHIEDMKRSGAPERAVELFLALRRDGMVDLKRSVAATAMLAEGHFDAYIEMTGKRVQLKPKKDPESLPRHPITELNGLIGSYR